MKTLSLDLIEAARSRIKPYIYETPFYPSDQIAEAAAKDLVLVKAETFQRTGSFKIRGATNCVLENLAQAKKAGVVAASAGNHAQGVGAICKTLGIKATIVMPNTTPTIKIHNSQKYGANVLLQGEVYDDAYVHAQEISKSTGAVLIHPYLDIFTMAGQGTTALEMLERPEFDSVEAVLISVGGGGLISGCAAAIKTKRPHVKVYGVTAANAPSVYDSFKQKKAVTEPVKFTIAEGVATKKCEPMMLAHLEQYVDDIFSISEEDISAGVSFLAEKNKMIVEGAGVLPVAALLTAKVKEKKVAVVLSGANIDMSVLSHVLHRELVRKGRLLRLTLLLPDRPGALNSMTEVFSKTRANIVQVFHERDAGTLGVGEAQVLVTLETRGQEHSQSIIKALEDQHFQVRREE